MNSTKNNMDFNEHIIGDVNPRWYIIQTYVGFEDAVRKALELKISNLSIEDKFLEIFIPTKKIFKTNKKGEKVEKEEKIYPGYIYVKMILDKETGYIIQNTSYVSRITGTGDFAVPIEDSTIQNLKEKLLKENEKIGNAIQTNFKIGDLIKVVSGPFKDMSGRITGLDPKNPRLNVSLTIFERETNVELDTTEIVKVLG